VQHLSACSSYCLGCSFRRTLPLVTAVGDGINSLNGPSHSFDQFSIVLGFFAPFSNCFGDSV
jgi:hypothetical protein